jgi:hypothetical protein
MSRVERRLQEALNEQAMTTVPARDLFVRVRGSIEDDRVRRRAVWRRVGTVLGLVVAAGLLVLALSDVEGGRLVMAWWVLELLTTLLLVGVALWLGPFIKRFGRAYAADVFHDNPGTGKSYIVLADIVYYLIFAAYILMTVTYAPRLGWGTTVGAEQLAHETVRVGGILLIIGVLHGLNILTMPLLGRLFSLNRRVDRR